MPSRPQCPPPVGIARTDRHDRTALRPLHRRDHLLDGDLGAAENPPSDSLGHQFSSLVSSHSNSTRAPHRRLRLSASPARIARDTFARSVAAAGQPRRHRSSVRRLPPAPRGSSPRRATAGRSGRRPRRRRGNRGRRRGGRPARPTPPRLGARSLRSRRAAHRCAGLPPTAPLPLRSSRGPRAARADRALAAFEAGEQPADDVGVEQLPRPSRHGRVSPSSGAPRGDPWPGAP